MLCNDLFDRFREPPANALSGAKIDRRQTGSTVTSLQGTSWAHDNVIECETTRNVEIPRRRSEAQMSVDGMTLSRG